MTQQVKSGTPAHRALDRLQATDLSFHRAGTPGQRQGSPHRCQVTPQSTGEPGKRRFLSGDKPTIQPFLPLLAVYWPKGYPEIPNKPGFSLGQAGRSWTDSLIFDPRMLLLLLPLAIVGRVVLRPWVAALLAAAIVPNALFYTFYEHTHLHPRFLYVALPPLFVLEAAGGAAIRDVWKRTQRTHTTHT